MPTKQEQEQQQRVEAFQGMTQEEQISALFSGLDQVVASVASASTQDEQTHPYFVWRQEFKGIDRRTSLTPQQAFHETDLEKFERPEFVPSATGKLLYSNGVIADPETGEVLFKPGSVAPGSEAWLLKIQEEWTDKEANAWRKRLNKLGFVPTGGLAEEGGIAHDLLSALRLFHETRYANFGKVIPAAPRGEQTKQLAREAYDPLEVKTDARALLTEVFGDDPSDEEVKRATPHVMRAVRRALSSGATLEKARLRGEETLIEEIAHDPAVRKWQELEETDTALHDSFVNLFQVLS